MVINVLIRYLLAIGQHVPGFLKLLLFMCQYVYVCMCVCVYVSTPRPLIMSGMIWCDIDRVCMVGHTILLDCLPRETALPYSFESIDACTGFLMFVCMTHLPNFISFHGLVHVFQHS